MTVSALLKARRVGIKELKNNLSQISVPVSVPGLTLRKCG